MIFFTSDSHYNHRAIIEHCRRPYADVRSMNEAMIADWNAVVGPSDDVYHLGDFGFKGEDDLDTIWWRLNGHKHLVVGNHDKKNPKVLKLPWESVSDLKVVKKDERKLVLCHYPMESWPSMWKGSAHLHGHCHGTLRRKMAKRYDVGVDAHPSPIAWPEIWAWADAEPFVPVDHHGEGRTL